MNVMKTALLVGMLGVLIASCTSGEGGGDQQGADLILSGAKIFTSNAQQPWVEAIAVNDGRFTYVGDAAGALAYQSDNTRLLTLKGNS